MAMKGEVGARRGTLFVVATPIGNLEDITLRALKILAEVDVIACEDTRRTALLLRAHKIAKPLISYFEHNEEHRAQELIEQLRTGVKVALVTDAGTPGISDPGYRLVRGAHAAGCAVVALPGPSAVTAALSVAGLGGSGFSFVGFLPARPSERRNALIALKREPRTLVFFEAARRLPQSLASMAAVLGAERTAVVAREMTKVFEEVVLGTLGDLAARFSRAGARGEVTLLVAAASKSKAFSTSESPAASSFADRRQLDIKEPPTIEMLRQEGISLKQASRVIARIYGLSRRQAYQLGLGSEDQRLASAVPVKSKP
jgi:16S rRNA (cytidine1402-2'-O)-methyltransferase